MSREYFCPNCDETIEFGEFQMVADCPSCEHTIELDADGEHRADGAGWRDLTKAIDATARHQRWEAEIERRAKEKLNDPAT